jgi:RCC1 and BTB domain-containing protein
VLPGSIKIKGFSCGEEHSAIVTHKGQALTWGYGNDGQLGHKERTNLSSPKKVLFDTKIEQVFCGGGHTGLITEEGDLYLMGRGRDGQLGRGDENESMAAYRTDPKRVEKLKDNRVQAVALGQNHTVALVASMRK